MKNNKHVSNKSKQQKREVKKVLENSQGDVLQCVVSL